MSELVSQAETRTLVVAPAELIMLPPQGQCMPATLEVVCTADDCELDMFEMHYTYDMPEDVELSSFRCPYCGTTDALSEVAL